MSNSPTGPTFFGRIRRAFVEKPALTVTLAGTQLLAAARGLEAAPSGPPVGHVPNGAADQVRDGMDKPLVKVEFDAETGRAKIPATLDLTGTQLLASAAQRPQTSRPAPPPLPPRDPRPSPSTPSTNTPVARVEAPRVSVEEENRLEDEMRMNFLQDVDPASFNCYIAENDDFARRQIFDRVVQQVWSSAVGTELPGPEFEPCSTGRSSKPAMPTIGRFGAGVGRGLAQAFKDALKRYVSGAIPRISIPGADFLTSRLVDRIEQSVNGPGASKPKLTDAQLEERARNTMSAATEVVGHYLGPDAATAFTAAPPVTKAILVVRAARAASDGRSWPSPYLSMMSHAGGAPSVVPRRGAAPVSTLGTAGYYQLYNFWDARSGQLVPTHPDVVGYYQMTQHEKAEALRRMQSAKLELVEAALEGRISKEEYFKRTRWLPRWDDESLVRGTLGNIWVSRFESGSSEPGQRPEDIAFAASVIDIALTETILHGM